MKNLKRLAGVLGAVALIGAAVAIVARASAQSYPPPLGTAPDNAIPSLLRSRVSANESATIGDIRTFIVAQHEYAQANGGWYEGNPTCLYAPSNPECIPNYQSNAPTFLDPNLATLESRTGYIRSFVPGPPPDFINPDLSSPSSVQSFGYLAWPVVQGRTGVRGFGGDSTGVLCFVAAGDPPAVDETTGLLDLTRCNVLQ